METETRASKPSNSAAQALCDRERVVGVAAGEGERELLAA
jgi:hypothetical protein